MRPTPYEPQIGDNVRVTDGNLQRLVGRIVEIEGTLAQVELDGLSRRGTFGVTLDSLQPADALYDRPKKRSKRRQPSIEFVVACVALIVGGVLIYILTWLYRILATGRRDPG